MYRSARMRIRRPLPVPLPEAEPTAAPVTAPAEPDPLEAAATIACRTSVTAETLGADGKAAVVLSLLGIMFTVLARFGGELGTALRGGAAGGGATAAVARVACAALLLGFVACGVAAVVFAFRTISPRLR